MNKKHLISKEKHSVFFDINFFKKKKLGFINRLNCKKLVPDRTLCGLETNDFKKGEGITTPDNCDCELCLQVEDNIQKHWREL